ncbi:MAG: hypothetical protein WAU88_12220 [Candidatus Zixiibacteriota bacterium]
MVRIQRIAATLCGAFVLLIIWGCTFAWRRLPYYTDYGEVVLRVPVMSEAGYDSVFETHARPYVYELEFDSGAVLIYGAEHTKDPADSQIADIETRWRQFQPTIALCESRLGILFPGIMNPVREMGEAGWTHYLARRDGVPTFSWEPTPAVLMEQMLRLPYSREQIALRLKLGPYFSNRRNGRPDSPEAYIEDYLGASDRWPGLETTLINIPEIDACWKRNFQNGPDWREVSDEHDLPGFLDSISTNPARDEHFVRVVIDLVKRGERVFAVAGSSHAFKLEPALRGAR